MACDFFTSSFLVCAWQFLRGWSIQHSRNHDESPRHGQQWCDVALYQSRCVQKGPKDLEHLHTHEAVVIQE